MAFLRECKIYCKDFLENNTKTELLLFCLIFVFNLLMIIPVYSTYISDEYGVIATAAFISGKYDWSGAVSSTAPIYFGYGLALFYAPLFWIFNNIISVYKVALAINAVFIGLIPVFVHKISVIMTVKHDNLRTRVMIFLLSLAIGVTPCYTILSKLTLNETMVMFLPWLMILLLLKMIRTNNTLHLIAIAIALGFIGVFGYATHGRMIATLGILAITVIFYSIKQKKYLQVLAPFALSTTLFYLIDSAIKGVLYLNLYSGEAGDLVNTLESSTDGLLLALMSWSNIKDLFKGFMGQTFYLTFSTWGLIILGAILFFRLCLRQLKHKNIPPKDLLVGFFSLGSLLSMIAVSVLSFRTLYIIDETSRYEYYMYGRYNEPFAILVIFFVLIYVIRHERLVIKGFYYFTLVGFFLYGGALTILRNFAKIPKGSSFLYMQVVSIIPYVTKEFIIVPRLRDFMLLLLFGTLIIFAVFVLLKKNRTLITLIILIAVSLYSSIYVINTQVYPNSRNREEWISFLDVTKEITENSDINEIFIINTGRESVFDAQYAYPNTPVSYLNLFLGLEEIEKIPENSLIIGSNCEYLESFEGIYQVEVGKKYQLLIYGEELYEAICDSPYMIIKKNTEQVVAAKALTVNGNYLSEGQSLFLFSQSEATLKSKTIAPGKYSLDIYGDSLNNVEIDLVYGEGTQMLNPGSVDIESGSHLTITFDTKVFISDLSISIRTEDEIAVPVKISYLVLRQNSGFLNKNKASNYFFHYRDLFKGGFLSDKYFLYSGDYIVGSRGVVLKENASAILSGIAVKQGSFYLNVEGELTDDIDIEIIDDVTNTQIPYEYTKMTNEKATVCFKVQDSRTHSITAIVRCKKGEITFRGFAVHFIR
jgi:hypothetical protein